MALISSESNMLLGILAVQMDFIDRDALFAAMNAWVLEKQKSLGQILEEQGRLSCIERGLLEALVAYHLKRHGGEAEKSLAAADPSGAIRRDLQQTIGGDKIPQIVDGTLEAGAASGGEDSTVTWGIGQGRGSAGRFLMLRPHAKGGLGSVSVALDHELNREVALKQILPEHADLPTHRARFVQEAEITGRLEHPGVVPVYSLGSDQSGRPYYAMRLVPGDTLKEAIHRFHSSGGTPGRGLANEQSMEFRRLLGRFLDVCNTVGYAHSRGVIHRDLKPSNIMLGPYGETLVVDWGLAKVVGADESCDGDLLMSLRKMSGSGGGETQAGAAMGTPGYMSPEQAAGQLDRVSRASDVYSLGATLYYLLTGKAPFGEGDVALILARVRRGEVVSPRQIRDGVSGSLEAVCLKAMAHQAEDRYPSARALAEDVEHWLADEPVSVHREAFATRAGRWARRHQTTAVAATAVLVAATAALAVGTVLIRTAHRETDRQRLLAENNFRDARKAVDDYLTTVSQSSLGSVAGTQPLRRELLEKALAYYRDFQRRGRGEHSLHSELAEASVRIGQIVREIGSKEEAAAALNEAVRIYNVLVKAHAENPEYFRRRAEILAMLAVVQAEAGHDADATRSYRDATDELERLVQARPTDVTVRAQLAEDLLQFGAFLKARGQEKEGQAILRRAARRIFTAQERSSQ